MHFMNLWFLSLFQMHVFRGLGWTVWSMVLVTLQSWWDVLEWQHNPVFFVSVTFSFDLQQLHPSTILSLGERASQPWVCTGLAREWDPAPLRLRHSGAWWAVPHVSCSDSMPCSLVQCYNGARVGGQHWPHLHHCPPQRKGQCHQHFHLQPVILWHSGMCLLPPLHCHIHNHGPLGVWLAVMSPGAVHPVCLCECVSAVSSVYRLRKAPAYH